MKQNDKIKQEIKKAEKKVKKELKPINDLVTANRETQIKEMKESLEEIIRLENLEEQINNSIEFYGSHRGIKKRLVHLYCTGRYTLRQIAQMFNVSTQTISKWLKQEDVKQAIETYQNEEDIIATSMLKALRVRAIERQAELIDGDNPMVAAIMIRDLLDRTGHKPVEKKQVDVNMTYEEKLQQLVEGVAVEIIDVNESDLSQDTKQNTEGEEKVINNG